jgi:hypothetical protein
MAASGKKNPLDPDPTPDGNILITGDEATVLKGEALGQARKDGLDLYLSHFATCPQRMSFKK